MNAGRYKKTVARYLLECSLLGAVLFTLCFVGSDPEAELAAAKGPTMQERMEIVSRHPVSRAEYETLRIYGWDKDRANHQEIILDQDSEPQLVDYKPAKGSHGNPD